MQIGTQQRAPSRQESSGDVSNSRRVLFPSRREKSHNRSRREMWLVRHRVDEDVAGNAVSIDRERSHATAHRHPRNRELVAMPVCKSWPSQTSDEKSHQSRSSTPDRGQVVSSTQNRARCRCHSVEGRDHNLQRSEYEIDMAKARRTSCDVTSISWVCVVVSVCFSLMRTSAWAQEPPAIELSGGYSFLTAQYGDNFPLGGFASVDWRATRQLALVGRVATNFDERNITTQSFVTRRHLAFLGGARLNLSAAPSIEPFVEVLAGASHFESRVRQSGPPGAASTASTSRGLFKDMTPTSSCCLSARQPDLAAGRSN